MVDITRRDAPQLCPCGHAPLQCSLATLAIVQNALITDPRNSPECCLTIARKETADLAKARQLAMEIFSRAREILQALRDDETGRTTAAHLIENAAVALEYFFNAAARRNRQAIALLRKRFGKDACPACRDESELRKAAKRLRWCASMLGKDAGPTRRGEAAEAALRKEDGWRLFDSMLDRSRGGSID